MTPIDYDAEALVDEFDAPSLLDALAWCASWNRDTWEGIDGEDLIEEVLVWRVERPRLGDGPYQPVSNSERLQNFSWRLSLAHTDFAHPGPYLDGIQYVYKTEAARFGFVSLEAAAEWFAGWGRGLQYHGFRVVGYQVPVCLTDPGDQGLQVAFIRAAARRVASLTPAEAGIF